MKRVFPLIFVFIFLTYHLGYYGVYLIMQYKIECHWQQKLLGNELNSSDLEKISTPLSLPYRADQQEYQKASGSINVDGKFYRFVKYRYAQDTLHFLYVKDNKMANLHKALHDWAVSFTSIPVSEKGNVELWKSMIKDFIFLPSFLLEPSQGSDCNSMLGGTTASWYMNLPEVPSPPPKQTYLLS